MKSNLIRSTQIALRKNPGILCRAADTDKDWEEKEIIQRSYFGGIVIYQHNFS